jgi:hypothetical protein
MSYWGLAGGLWATSTFGLLTILATVDPEGNSRWLAVLFGVLMLAFVPAIVYSVLPGPRRREAVLRFETALCLALAFLGLFVLGDIGWPIILSPPTILLATGAGLVFTGRRGKAG